MKAGITGHQNLGADPIITWVRNTLADLIHDHKISQGFTCLAKGADQLFAQILTEKEIPFTAVIPCSDYDKAFEDQSAKSAYLGLVQKAGEIIRLNFARPSEEAFFAAGKKVVQCSDLVFAVWNGEPAAGLGGTGDIVKFSKQAGKPVVHLNPVTLKVTVL